METTAELIRLGGLSAQTAITGSEAATDGMKRIEEISDADIAEVRESATLFQEVEDTTADLRSLLDLLTGLGWLTAGMTKRERKTFESQLVDTLEAQPREAYSLLARGVFTDGSHPESAFTDLWNKARSVAEREGFLYWEAAFPGVWHSWQSAHPQGGFDAVIGNPPWDRIKLQEVEWFATRSPELAHAPTAAGPEERRRPVARRRVSPGVRVRRGEGTGDGLGNMVARLSTIPCWAAATSTCTRCLSNAPWG